MRRTRTSTRELAVVTAAAIVLFWSVAWMLDVALYANDVVRLGHPDWYVTQAWEAWAAAACIAVVVHQGLMHWVHDRRLELSLRAMMMELARVDRGEYDGRA